MRPMPLCVVLLVVSVGFLASWTHEERPRQSWPVMLLVSLAVSLAVAGFVTLVGGCGSEGGWRPDRPDMVIRDLSLGTIDFDWPGDDR